MTSLQKTLNIVDAALQKKAYGLVVLQAEHLNSIADYFVIATGRSDIQVQAIAEGIDQRLDGDGEHPLGVEGLAHGYWVVMDYDDVVVHIFYEPVRDLYRLETNWTDARQVPLPEPFSSLARQLSVSA